MSNSPAPRAKSVDQFGKVSDIKLSQIPALEECDPGMMASEYNVIICPATLPEKTQGGIILSDHTKESFDMAQQVGIIVDQSPIAHDYAKWPTTRPCPQIGDIIWFARYAGGEFSGPDDRTYRMIKDKDVGAIIKRHGTGAPNAQT